jgi:hypothetical protein
MRRISIENRFFNRQIMVKQRVANFQFWGMLQTVLVNMKIGFNRDRVHVSLVSWKNGAFIGQAVLIACVYFYVLCTWATIINLITWI